MRLLARGARSPRRSPYRSVRFVAPYDVATEPLEQAIASTRRVLTAVSKEQLGDDTPCAAWKVSDLINHNVGGQYFFEAGAKGQPPAGGETDFSAAEFVSAFDEAAQHC